MTTLILPGLGNSGPEHWQSHWEREDPTCVRVEQAQWDRPRCDEWVQTLDIAFARIGGPVVLVAHSSACALVAHWARRAAPPQVFRVRGALLVAPSGTFAINPTLYKQLSYDPASDLIPVALVVRDPLLHPPERGPRSTSWASF